MWTEAIHLFFDLAALAGVLVAMRRVLRLQRVISGLEPPVTEMPPPPKPRCSNVSRCSNFADPRCVGGGCMVCCVTCCSPHCSVEFQKKVERLTQQARAKDRSLN